MKKGQRHNIWRPIHLWIILYFMNFTSKPDIPESTFLFRYKLWLQNLSYNSWSILAYSFGNTRYQHWATTALSLPHKSYFRTQTTTTFPWPMREPPTTLRTWLGTGLRDRTRAWQHAKQTYLYRSWNINIFSLRCWALTHVPKYTCKERHGFNRIPTAIV